MPTHSGKMWPFTQPIAFKVICTKQPVASHFKSNRLLLGQKKLTKIIGVDPYRNKAHNKATTSSTKGKVPTGVANKLIGVEKKATVTGLKCRICKCSIHQVGSHYCQTCAYQKGICAMCGKRILNTTGLRQSVV